jgi:hypothetical protein
MWIRRKSASGAKTRCRTMLPLGLQCRRAFTTVLHHTGIRFQAGQANPSSQLEDYYQSQFDYLANRGFAVVELSDWYRKARNA